MRHPTGLADVESAGPFLFSSLPTFGIIDGKPKESEEPCMRVLGIDPGIAIMGFGFVDQAGHRLVPVQYGCIRTDANVPTEQRLRQIYDAVCAILDKYRPDAGS